MDFIYFVRAMNTTPEKPIGIKINPDFYQRLLQQNFVLRKPNENPLATFTGLPVQEDDTISTFEFVYKDVE